MFDFTKTTIWTGKTFAIKDALKAEGATWHEDSKEWRLPAITGQAETVRVERLWCKPGVDVRHAD